MTFQRLTDGQLSRAAERGRLLGCRRRPDRKAADKRYNSKRRMAEETRAVAKFHGGVLWRKLAKRYRLEHPLCCDPLDHHHGHPHPADCVHHIQPLVRRPDLALDWDNLASLCWSCHNIIDQMEARGLDTSPRFKRKGKTNGAG